jgi:hypothetical protein
MMFFSKPRKTTTVKLKNSNTNQRCKPFCDSLPSFANIQHPNRHQAMEHSDEDEDTPTPPTKPKSKNAEPEMPEMPEMPEKSRLRCFRNDTDMDRMFYAVSGVRLSTKKGSEGIEALLKLVDNRVWKPKEREFIEFAGNNDWYALKHPRTILDLLRERLCDSIAKSMFFSTIPNPASRHLHCRIILCPPRKGKRACRRFGGYEA